MEGPFKEALVILPMLLLPYSKQLCNAAVKTTATALLSFTLISFTFNALCSKAQIFESQIFQPTTISTDVHRRIGFGGQKEAHIEQLSVKKRMNKFTSLSARKGEETEEEHKMNERWRTETWGQQGSVNTANRPRGEFVQPDKTGLKSGYFWKLTKSDTRFNCKAGRILSTIQVSFTVFLSKTL